MSTALERIKTATRGRSRLVGGAVAAGIAAGVAAVRARRDRDTIELPDPGPLAAETAVSVHNAAKFTVLTTVRESERPDQDLITSAVRSAVADAIDAGVDVVSVALGAVAGAASAARLIDAGGPEMAVSAALAATDEAGKHSRTASKRVRDLLADHLPIDDVIEATTPAT